MKPAQIPLLNEENTPINEENTPKIILSDKWWRQIAAQLSFIAPTTAPLIDTQQQYDSRSTLFICALVTLLNAIPQCAISNNFEDLCEINTKQAQKPHGEIEWSKTCACLWIIMCQYTAPSLAIATTVNLAHAQTVSAALWSAFSIIQIISSCLKVDIEETPAPQTGLGV